MSQDALAQLVFPCGKGGINRSRNFVDFPPTDLTMADGLTTEYGTWRKEGGARRYNAVPLTEHLFGTVAEIDGLYSYYGTSVFGELLVSDGAGGLILVSPTGAHTVLSTDITKHPWFQEGFDGGSGLKTLYIASGLGGQQPILQYLSSGASATPIANPNTDWPLQGYPSFLIQHRERMVAFGGQVYLDDLFFSRTNDHGNFTGGDSVRQAVAKGKGSGISACLSWRQKLYVFKDPVGVFIFDDSSVNVAEWGSRQLSNSHSALSQFVVCEVDNDVVFMGRDGYFYSLGQVEHQGEQAAAPILPMESGDFLRSLMDLTFFDEFRLVWYSHKRQLHFFFRTLTAQPHNNDARVIIDFASGTPRLLYSRRDDGTALAMIRETGSSYLKPAIGGNDGYVYILDEVTRSKSGSAYRGQFETPPRPFFPDGIRKGNLEHLEVVFEPKGEWDLEIEIHRDGALSQTIAFSQQSAGGAVGSFSLDGDVLGGTTIANKRMRALGDAQYVKLVGRNTVAGQDFSIQEMVLHFTPGAEAA